MKKTKIDWADSTWNPVTGCLHGCEYCYARKIAERFKGGCEFVAHGTPEPLTWVVDDPGKRENGQKAVYPFGFDPTFHRYKLDEPKRWTKPRTIFVCSMADLFGDWVPNEWIKDVFDVCEAAPRHRYLFLTKNPKRYTELLDRYFPGNMWFGWSQTGPIGDKTVFETHHSVHTFVSLEPLLEPFKAFRIRGIGWAIVGAETGNRKGKVIPEKSWVMGISDACKEANIPIFMKGSLREIMGNDFKQEFPW